MTAPAVDAAPFACPTPQPAALMRLVCFPHAGGGPGTFRRWARALAPDIELWNVTLPGRAARAREPFAREWPPLVEELAAAADGAVPRPFALFGHSLGALVAFEVARGLTRAGAPPSRLVVSARGAPDLRTTGEIPKSDEELLRRIAAVYGGVPDAVRTSPELLDHFLPILRADLELAIAYTFTPGPPLRVPITALRGRADPTVSRAGLERWRRHTAAQFELHEFADGHFYLERHQRAVIETVRTAVLRSYEEQL